MFETGQPLYEIVIIVCIILFGLFFYRWQKERTPAQKTVPVIQTQTADIVKIQAYERLVTFVDRCGFGALIERLPAGSLSAKQLAEVYIESMRNEFEYNLSQQIYVSATIWQAVCDAKDQQVFIIKQLVDAIPANAPAEMLEKSIQILLKADQNASIQPVVLDAVKKEARQNLMHK